MEFVEGRTLLTGEIVQVYRNLNKKGEIYSIKHKKTGLVVAYAETVLLSNVSFRVSEASRQRVIKEQRKNVHAWIEGIYIDHKLFDTIDTFHTGYYNPYTCEHFIDLNNKQYLKELNVTQVVCHSKYVYYLSEDKDLQPLLF